MKIIHSPPSEEAFTRLELLVLLLTMALLATATLPALAGLRARSDVAVCGNGLRLIGRAFDMWGADHNGGRPWRVWTGDGGTGGHPLVANPWLHFSWVSNQLATPRILTCPADLEKRAATDFSGSPNGGFVNSGFRNNAVSYLIGADIFFSALLPQGLLCMDRNVRPDSYAACSVGANNVAQLTRGVYTSAWTNGIHYPIGNVLLNDGRVVQASVETLWQIKDTGDDNGSVHLLYP
jgi:hypothetical protein